MSRYRYFFTVSNQGLCWAVGGMTCQLRQVLLEHNSFAGLWDFPFMESSFFFGDISKFTTWISNTTVSNDTFLFWTMTADNKDPVKKKKGIQGLGCFLDRSKTLTILWSPRYFSRLWCGFELATFLRHKPFGDPSEQRAVEIMPTKLAVFFCAYMFACHACFDVLMVVGNFVGRTQDAEQRLCLVMLPTDVGGWNPATWGFNPKEGEYKPVFQCQKSTVFSQTVFFSNRFPSIVRWTSPVLYFCYPFVTCRVSVCLFMCIFIHVSFHSCASSCVPSLERARFAHV